MSGLENLDSKLIRQYSSAYGPFTPGDYQIGQQLRGPGISGTVIWSFRAGGTGPLTYVVDDSTGFPAEVEASEVQG